MPWSPTKYDLERLENRLFYERERSRIERRHRRKWVAIARGRIVSVSATAEGCIAEANRAAPRCNHRFVFQVGVPLRDGWRLQEHPPGGDEKKDEGKKDEAKPAVNECKDIEQCGANLVNKHALGKLLKKAGGTMEDDYDNERTCMTLKGKTKCWKWQRPPKSDFDEFYESVGAYALMNCIEITFDNPKTKEKKTKCALLDTGVTGAFAHLDPANFLVLCGTSEHPDDNREVKGVGGTVKVRNGFASMEIPQIGFEVKLVMVTAGKDALKAEVERQKKAEEEKKKDKK